MDNDKSKDNSISISGNPFHLAYRYLFGIAINLLSMLRKTIFTVIIFLAVGIFSTSLLFPKSALASSIIFDNTTTSLGSAAFGLNVSGGNTQDIGQISATPSNSGYVCSIDLYLSKSGTPTDNLKLWVYSLGNSTSSSPDPGVGGSLVTSTTIPASSLTGSEAVYTFTFPNCWTAVPGAYYNLKLSRTGTYSVANYFTVAYVSGRWMSFDKEGLTGWAFNSPNNLSLKMTWSGYYNLQTAGFFPSSTISFPGFTSSSVDCASYYTTLWSSSTFQALTCYADQVIRSGVQWVFMPSSSLPFINSAFASTTQVFPFNLFFQFQDVAQSAINNFNVSSTDLLFPVVMPNGASTTIHLLTSSSISGVVGSQTMVTWFDFQKYLAWALAGYFMVRVMML